jgi:hypothetical protein
MSTTIYIRINGVQDSIPINVTDSTTIGDIKDHIISKEHAVDRTQIKLAYLGNIITHEHDGKTLFSMDNCSSMLINGKTIHVVIEKWSAEKIEQYKKANQNNISQVEGTNDLDYNIIIEKFKSIYDFVIDKSNTELVKALYFNGLDELLDRIFIAFDKKEVEHLPVPQQENDTIIEKEPSQFEKDKKTYILQLNVLSEMGFEDIVANIESLKKYNGSIQEVINHSFE